MVDAKTITSGYVTVKAYDIDPDEWYSSDDKEKLLDSTEPDEVSENHNITCIGMHQSLVRAINPEDAFSDHPRHLALGDGTADPQYENTELNNEVYRKEIDEVEESDTSLQFTAWFEPYQATNTEINEVGLFSTADGGTLWNHSVIGTINRVSQRVIAIDVELTFDND